MKEYIIASRWNSKWCIVFDKWDWIAIIKRYPRWDTVEAKMSDMKKVSLKWWDFTTGCSMTLRSINNILFWYFK